MSRISTFEWALKHIDSEGIQRVLKLPMCRPILDRMDERRGRVVQIIGPAQVFKTALGQVHLLKSMLHAAAPVAWYCDTEPAVGAFAKFKLNGLWEACPALRKLAIGDPDRQPTTERKLANGGHLQVLSQGVGLNRNSLTLQGIYMDESWLYEPGHVPEIQKRRESFSRSQDWWEIHMNTGPLDGTDAALLWHESDQSVWHSACPECGHLFPMELGDEDRPGGLRYAAELVRGKQQPDWNAVRASARYQCPKCERLFKYSHALLEQMNDPGRGAGFVSMNPKADVNTVGIRVPGLALRDWSDIAKKWAAANRQKITGDTSMLQEVITKDLAQVWKPRDLYKAEANLQTGAYSMGEVWEQAAAHPVDGYKWVIMTVDVQLDHFVVVVRAWNKNAQSRGVWFEKVFSIGAVHDLAERFHILPALVFLDARNNKTQVLRYCAPRGWYALMGDKAIDYRHEDGVRRMYSETHYEDPFFGTENAGRQIAGYKLFSKQSALNRLHILRSSKNSDGELMWSVPHDAPEWYRNEVNAFKNKRRNNGDGTFSDVWDADGSPDHAADGEAMQITVASMAGFIGA